MLSSAIHRSARRPRPRRRLRLQTLEQRQLLAGDLPFGATPIDTGEYLLGSVTVTPVFFESDGSIDPNTQDWTEIDGVSEIDLTLDKIRESVDWWTRLLATKTSKHSLSFEIDETYARNPVTTGYEPIDRSSTTFQRYVGSWLTDLGYGDAPSIERAVHLFNDSQRRAHRTDWAFTIFVVDSSDDEDGFFAEGGFQGAFAYPGGLFYIVPSERPVSTYAHEMGHIFWARDEYRGAGSYTDERGYYNAQNINASDNPTPGFVQEDSIMRGGVAAVRAYDELITADSTLELLGWRDSDGDGIFDVLDVPLQLDAAGWFDSESSRYVFQGSASIDTLENLNSSGTQSDITLAKVGTLQYRLDGGEWIDALAVDQVRVDFDLRIPITQAFDEIQWRAVDDSTGNSSPVLTGSVLTPIVSGIGGGFAYVDQNSNGVRDLNEPVLDGTRFTIVRSDGGPLGYQPVIAATMDEQVLAALGGLSFASIGEHVDGRVAVVNSKTNPSVGKVLTAYDTIFGEWNDRWGGKRKLEILTDESTGQVAIDFVALDTGTYGFDTGSYARIEAFDEAGNLIGRATSDLVQAGQGERLVIEDPRGRIARVLIHGHADTEILLTAVEFGHASMVIDDRGGTFAVDNLPDGSYRVETDSPNVIYQFDSPYVTFDVVQGLVQPISIAASRVDSPRHNRSLPGDVNGDQVVTALDALVVINDLGVLGNRLLTANDPQGYDVDVNNDGQVTTIDALMVINTIERNIDSQTAESELVAPASTPLNRVAVDHLMSVPMDAGTSFDDEDRYSTIDPNNPKMFNSAARRVSGQSQDVPISDTESWMVQRQLGFGGADSDASPFAAEFPLESAEIDLGFGRRAEMDERI